MSDYLSEILEDDSESTYVDQEATMPVGSDGTLVSEEQELAEALISIAEKYGKFNSDNTGIWAGYDSAEKNVDNAKIGVKCGNCVFFNAPNGCQIIAAEVEEGGLCRFAVLPDGSVTPEKVFSKSPNLIQKELKEKVRDMEDDYTEEYVDISDLTPTQDYLKAKKLKDASDITKPVIVYQDDEGYKLVDGHHRCASKVVAGQSNIMAKVYRGPMVSAAMFISTPISPEDMELSNDGPCWDGYKQVGMKSKNGKMVPNCVPVGEASVTATAGSKPAPKKDQVKGSSKNKKGSAASGKGVTFSASVIKSLENKVAEHNKKAKPGRKVTLAKLKAVYRRGAGAFSTSHRPDQNRNSWAMGRVNAFLKLVRSGKPSNAKYTTDNDLLPRLHPRHSAASSMSPMIAAVAAALDDEDDCPPATQDIVINIENRQNAIDNVGYGPLNPNEPNDEFWQEKADRWDIEPVEAKKSICGNCVFFVKTPRMLDCISSGIAEGGSGEQNAWDAIDQADLGYCEALDFKCAAARTCNAWAAGGPITEEKAEVASGGAGTILPVLVKGAIKEPSKGPDLETVMSNPKKIRYSRNTELALRQKLVEHNATADESCLATLDMFKAVYRRGAGAFATSGRPDQERNKLAMSRVAAFSHLLKAGEPKNSSYTADNDLLPATHSKSSMSSEGMTASGSTKYEEALTVSILSEDEYASQEHAVFALAEYSGLGYETIPAIRAAWIRGIKNNENPFERAAVLASALYNSPDADLLPKKGTL